MNAVPYGRAERRAVLGDFGLHMRRLMAFRRMERQADAGEREWLRKGEGGHVRRTAGIGLAQVAAAGDVAAGAQGSEPVGPRRRRTSEGRRRLHAVGDGIDPLGDGTRHGKHGDVAAEAMGV